VNGSAAALASGIDDGALLGALQSAAMEDATEHDFALAQSVGGRPREFACIYRVPLMQVNDRAARSRYP
jgi:hypothetical protein